MLDARRHDRSSWARRATASHGRTSTRRSPTARWPGVAVDDGRRGRGRRRDGVDVHRSADRRGDRRRSRWTAAPHGLALVDRRRRPAGCTSRTARPTDPGYDVIAVGGDAAKDGPVDTGTHPAAGPGTWVTFDEASQMVHILGRARTRRTAPAADATVYVVEPHAQRGLRRRAAARRARPGAGSWTSSPTTRRPTARSSSPSTPTGAVAIDRRRLARLRLAAAGRHRRRAHGRASSTCWPGSSSGAARRPCSSALFVARRRDALRPVADRHERRLRRAVHRRRLHALRGRSGRAGGGGRAAFWLAMPVIGVLLGLALASKWVAAYAIGGARPADPGAQRARAACSSILGLIGLTACSATWRSPCPPRARASATCTFLLIMVGADPDRGRRRGHPSDRLDRRGDALRGRRAGRPRERSSFLAPLATRLGPDGRSRSGRWRSRRSRSRSRSRLSLGRSPALFVARRAARVRAAAPPPGPDDPARLPRAAGAGRRTAGCGRAGALRPAGRLVRRSASSPLPARRLRRLVHPVGDGREPPARRRAGPPGHTGQTLARPDRARCTATTTA